jgi:hypothetical protein
MTQPILFKPLGQTADFSEIPHAWPAKNSFVSVADSFTVYIVHSTTYSVCDGLQGQVPPCRAIKACVRASIPAVGHCQSLTIVIAVEQLYIIMILDHF